MWKERKFDSLPHVVEVLTSRDPQVSLRSLRKQRDSIEGLVDEVVRGYHSGFNKAIHNYSQVISDLCFLIPELFPNPALQFTCCVANPL